MAEVLVEFDTIITTRNGHGYRPRACARVADSGTWEGWLEFLPVAQADAPVRSGRETEQPNRADTVYWAEGLTRVYLQGALDRALSSPAPGRASVAAEPAFDGPRPPGAPEAAVPTPRPVLDPFEVYAQGVDVLRQQLSALDLPHLRGIVLGCGFASNREADAASRDELTRIIVEGARRAAEGRET